MKLFSPVIAGFLSLALPGLAMDTTTTTAIINDSTNLRGRVFATNADNSIHGTNHTFTSDDLKGLRGANKLMFDDVDEEQPPVGGKLMFGDIDPEQEDISSDVPQFEARKLRLEETMDYSSINHEKLTSGRRLVEDFVNEYLQSFTMPTLTDGVMVNHRIHSARNYYKKTSGRCSGCRISRRMDGAAFGNTIIVSWVASVDRAGVTDAHRLEYGHVSTFTFTEADEFTKVNDFWYEYCTEGMGEVAVSDDGMVIGVLCGATDGNSIPGALNWQEMDPEHNEKAGWENVDWRRRGIYLLEWTGGAITQNPDTIVLINGNGGGVNYGHWSMELNNDSSEYLIRNKVSTWAGGHETAVSRRVIRAENYKVEPLPEAKCSGGHQYSNRLTHNSQSDTTSEFCMTDIGAMDWFVYDDNYPKNVSSTTNLLWYSPWGSLYVQPGGPGRIVSKGLDGWMAVATGPGNVFEGLANDDNARRQRLKEQQCIGTMNLPLKPEDFDPEVHKWKWFKPEVEGLGPTRAGKMQLLNWGPGGDTNGRYLLGYTPDFNRYENAEYYSVVELDNDMNVVNGPYDLTKGAWVEDSPGIYVPGSGCVVFPNAWKSSRGANYVRHWDSVAGRSELFRLTALCPKGGANPSPTTSAPTGSPTNVPTALPTTPPTALPTSTPTSAPSLATPGPTGSIATPGPTGSVATPSPTGSVATPSPTGSVATPSPTGSVATPSPTGSVATPSPTGSVATPSPTGSVATDAPTSTPTGIPTALPTGSPTSAPSMAPSKSGPRDVGCFQFDWEVSSFLFAAKDVDVDGCAKKCCAGGYKYVGLMKGNDCYCTSSDTFLPHGVDSKTFCKMPCNVNAGQMCGGTESLSVYDVQVPNGCPATNEEEQLMLDEEEAAALEEEGGYAYPDEDGGYAYADEEGGYAYADEEGGYAYAYADEEGGAA